MRGKARITWFIGGILVSLTLLSFILLSSVSSVPPKRAFYFWRTQWQPSPAILESLAQNRIQTLYMRFFDVEWDELGKTTSPVAPIQFQSPLPQGIEIVPVVYITNAVFLKLNYGDVETLADRVLGKVDAMAQSQRIPYRQLQIDCDWTDSSRRNYFHFAELLARKLRVKNIIVSSTIRLHQIKYAGRTGIPPVARGMLMFYNFGKIQADGSRNSIFNAEDAASYASFISNYPLNLDVVLPLFTWDVHSRDGKVLGLLENLQREELNSFDGFRSVLPDRYVAVRSFFFRGRYFMNGDLVTVEETTPDITREAATLAKRGAGWKKSYETVALFDINERELKTFSKPDIGAIFDRF